MDFLDLYRPGSGLSWRKLLVLIDYLPPEAALNTAIRNMIPEDELAANSGDTAKAVWSMSDGLIATLIDEIRILTWMYASKNSEQAIPKPVPIRRPGVTSGRKLRSISLETAQKMDPRLRGLSDEEAQAKLNRLTGGRINHG